jgi:hypothetical protein
VKLGFVQKLLTEIFDVEFLTVSMKLFMGCTKEFICSLMYSRLFCGSVWLKNCNFLTNLVEVFHIKLCQYLLNG